MKRLLTILMLFAFLVSTAEAAVQELTYGQDFYVKNKRSILSLSSNDPLYQFMGEVEDIINGTTGFEGIYLIPTTAPTVPVKGDVYFDLAAGNIKYYTTSWQTVAASTSSTLDEAYTAGQGIAIDIAAMTLTQADTAWSTLAIVSTAGTTNDYDCVTITTASAGYTGDSLYINGVTGSTDIRGDSWNMSQAGALTFSNGDYIENLTTDDVFEFASDDKEDFQLVLSGTDIIGFSSGSSAVTLEFNALDRFTGVESITGDAGADFAFATTNTGTFNFTIAQSGTGDNELRLSSAGTAANAVAITASTGGITNTAATSIIGTSAAGIIKWESTGGDLTLDATDKSILIDAGETSADDALVLTVGADSGIQITSLADIDITTTGAATEDISITNTGGSILLSASEAATNAISLQATAGAIDIDAIGAEAGDLTMNAADDMAIAAAGALTVTGTTTAAVTSPALTLGSTTTTAATILQSGTGDLALTSTDDITLTTNTTTTDNIVLTNTPGTSATAISIVATAGGVNIDAAAALDVDIAGGQVLLVSKDNAGSAIALTTNVGTSETIVITNTLGTGAGAITLTTSAATGDIDINAGDAITIDAGDVVITTDDAATAQFKVVAGGTHASATVIELETTDGGIMLDANGGANGDITLNSADDIVLTTAGKLTITNTEAVTISGALTMAGTTTVVGVVQVDQVVTDAAAYTVTAANSGKIHTIAALGQNTTIKLPAEADGLNYEFWYVGGAADAEDHNITSEDDGNYFIGSVVHLDTSDDSILAVFSDGGSNSKLTINNIDGGTVVKVTCDGSYWYVTGTVVSDTVPTFGDQ